MLDIVIATGNLHKFRELAGLLGVRGIRWHSLAEFHNIPAAAERGRTFEANAIAKASAAARATGFLALADDSGLEVDALGGKPGVRSARFAGRHGDDRANHEKLLRLLRGIPRATRGAQYRCSLALAFPARLVSVTQGTWRGRIAEAPRGHHGFGYDPIFIVPRFGKTVGQLADSTKRRFSHRAMAARRMAKVIERMARRSRTIERGAAAAGSDRRLRGRSPSALPACRTQTGTRVSRACR